MSNQMMERKSKEIIEFKENNINHFLYNTKIGRMLLKIIVLPCFSKIAGKYFDSRISKFKINSFIRKNQIDMSEYYTKDYKSFNDFFTRTIKSKCRKIIEIPSVLISPCDAKLSVYKLSDNLELNIKNSIYKINDLIDSNITDNYKNGYAMVFRLCVDDYHRYIFIDDGTLEGYHTISGKLHTVRPIAQARYPIFTQNHREWTILHTNNFGNCIQIEVGALMVGKIVNHKVINFKRGEEKGYFKFGGSTIILLVNDISIDNDILKNSLNGIETIVKLGEKIGRKKAIRVSKKS